MKSVTSFYLRFRSIKKAGIEKAGETIWALRDINFEVNTGDVVGIIGPNGAGKSTLLKILSRITEPTVGRVEIQGRVGSLLEVGTGFHPELTGRENIYLNGSILGMKRKEINQRFDEIVAFAGIGKFLDTPIKRYSSGMSVRLAFAVAAHLTTEILFIDEVLAVGDINFQTKCLSKMNAIARKGRTIFFVSHNLSAIRSLCNRVFLIKNGILERQGDPTEIIQYYTNELTSNTTYREWPTDQAPTNHSSILKKVQITDENGGSVDKIDTDDAINIVITYDVITKGSYVGLSIILYDSDNYCVFSTINNMEKNWYGKNMGQGTYKSTCHIPKNLLNNGWYHINLNLFGRNYQDGVLVPDSLRFYISDGAAIRGDYFGPYQGTVRPLLEWTTEMIKADK